MIKRVIDERDGAAIKVMYLGRAPTIQCKIFNKNKPRVDKAKSKDSPTSRSRRLPRDRDGHGLPADEKEAHS